MYTLGMGLREFVWRPYFGAQPATFVGFLLGDPPSFLGKFELTQITKFSQRSVIAKSFVAIIKQLEKDAEEVPGALEILQSCSKRFELAKQDYPRLFHV